MRHLLVAVPTPLDEESMCLSGPKVFLECVAFLCSLALPWATWFATGVSCVDLTHVHLRELCSKTYSPSQAVWVDLPSPSPCP